jgi:hypothetical protein
MSKINSEG